MSAWADGPNSNTTSTPPMSERMSLLTEIQSARIVATLVEQEQCHGNALGCGFCRRLELSSTEEIMCPQFICRSCSWPDR